MSGQVSALKQDLVSYISGDGRFALVGVQTEFPAYRGYPLKKPVIVVGLSSVELLPGGLGNYLGEHKDPTRGSLYGKTASITVYFRIFSPRDQGGERCHQLYEALCSALLLEDNGFGFVRMWCDSIGCDSGTHSNQLQVQATLQAAVSISHTALPIASFAVGYQGTRKGAQEQRSERE